MEGDSFRSRPTAVVYHVLGGGRLFAPVTGLVPSIAKHIFVWDRFVEVWLSNGPRIGLKTLHG